MTGTPARAPLRHQPPELLVRAASAVGEGPVFDPRSGRLCWVDIEAGSLFEEDLAGGRQFRQETGTLLGAAAPRASASGFAVAVASGFGFLDCSVLSVVDAVLPEPDRRMNDAKCDSRGRLWAGSTRMDFAVGHGMLHRWDGRSSSRIVRTGFGLPNGIGWDGTDRVMYVADSTTRLVLQGAFDAEDGMVGELRPFVTCEGGVPDGLALDVEGCVWLAVWDGWEVRRYDPRGRVIAVVPMPVQRPSSCAFAPDGRLVITSASAGLTPDQRRAQPLAGSVFVADVAVAGVPVAAFAA